jgi:hypothetical protein
LRNALAQLDAEAAEAKEAERQKADKAERQATAKALEDAADELEKGWLSSFKLAAENGAAIYNRHIHLFGPSGLPVLLGNLAVEIPSAVSVHAAGLRQRAAAVLGGNAPPTLPSPPKLEVIRPEPEPPTIQILTLQTIACRDASGERRVYGANGIHALPPAAAKTAMQRNLGIEPDSERGRELRRTGAFRAEYERELERRAERTAAKSRAEAFLAEIARHGRRTRRNIVGVHYIRSRPIRLRSAGALVLENDMTFLANIAEPN